MLQPVIHTLSFIKFSHSIFALPFALGAMVAAARGWPSPKIFLLIVAAMVTARSAAMAFNRIADAKIDAKNLRTQNRHLPQGILSKRFAVGLTVIAGGLFLLICYFINPLAFLLSPFVLIWLLAYSYTKRFTWLTHFWLGISLGLS
ncbi:MAG: UbiA family prenyltransferase, partial [Deltaproteobacteria bacterium]|nr:UbiA family prenyltransferase [Deltaproteobacteria bacterium]